MLAFFLGPIGRWLIVALLVSAFLATGYYRIKRIGWDERDAIAQEEAKQAEAASIRLMAIRQRVTEKVVIQYRDRIKTVEREGAEVIRYVEKLIPASTPDLPGGFRMLHDSAVTGRFPQATGGIDAAGSAPVPVAVAAETVAANYQACRLNAEQLTALQGWVREQATAAN